MREIIEKRLIAFSVENINLCRNLNNEYVSQHLTNQLVRSSTSSALNFGEAQAAESRKDFIHKSSIVLKELRETFIYLKIIQNAKLIKNNYSIKHHITECNELISIFHKTIKTSKSNIKNPK